MDIAKPIRILHIVGIMNRGGIETFLMNIYREIDHSRLQFDFLITREESGVFDEEIRLLGGKIFKLPHIRKVGLIEYRKRVCGFFEKNKEYNIVHCHMNTWSGLFLSIAKRYRVPVRIAHCHTNQQGFIVKSLKNNFELFFKKVMKMNIKRSSTHFFACSFEAGKWLFGLRIANDSMKIIKNGVDPEKLKYDKETYIKMRNELNVSNDDLVIGHVGSMTIPKNHKFIINVFKVLKSQYSNCKLILVGDGPLRNEIKEYIKWKGLQEDVILLGTRDDVHNLMIAFDIYMMPSLYEGFPVSSIEAQAATLPCIFSNKITKEVDMGMGLVSFISLNETLDQWARTVEKQYKKVNRDISNSKITSNGYDSKSTAVWLLDFYEMCSMGKGKTYDNYLNTHL